MMKKITSFFTLTALAGGLLLNSPAAFAHCEVPCGIFADQLRFESMLEDQTTIAKASAQITEFAETSGDGLTALSVNQASRWITTKEDHCKKIQETIAQYFMAQRIKTSDKDGYEKKLTAAHAVMQAAMKAKQNPSAEVAETLKKTILDFYRAYEGKEPDFAKHSH